MAVIFVTVDHQKSWLPRTMILRPGSAPSMVRSEMALSMLIAQERSPAIMTASSSRIVSFHAFTIFSR